MKTDFYEELSVTKGMKQVLDVLKLMYPKSKNYEDVLFNVMLEFEQIFFNPNTKVMTLPMIKFYDEWRKEVKGIGLPHDFDWTECIVSYEGKKRFLSRRINPERIDGKKDS